jgi:hypothetical protein
MSFSANQVETVTYWFNKGMNSYVGEVYRFSNQSDFISTFSINSV